MSHQRRRFSLVGRFIPRLLLFGFCGCGSQAPRQVVFPEAQKRLKSFTVAYIQASDALNHPPRNAQEVWPFLEKLGDPKEMLNSPIDGAELVVKWGVDLKTLRPQDNKQPVWGFERNSRGGKRWVLQARLPVEMSDQELRDAVFVPGLKSPF